MTEIEARGYIQGKLNCMNKCGVFEREDSENKDLCDNCEYCYLQGNFGQQKEAFEFAIQALEKQMPKKPGNKKYSFYPHSTLLKSKYGECPTCKTMQVDDECCANCGQKLDWSEE